MTSLGTELWAALGGIFRLQPSAFLIALHAPHVVALAIVTVLAAGLSEAIAQSVVLFANRVKPLRFVFSLGVSVVLFAFGFVVLVLSTWVILLLPGRPHVAMPPLALVLALAYAPLVFEFLGALPYLGSNLIWALRVWHLLAMVVGLAAIAHISPEAALTYTGLGWLALSLANQTVGKPIVKLGERILDAVAGVRLTDADHLGFDPVRARAPQPTVVDGGAAEEAVDDPLTVAARRHSRTWRAALGGCAMLALAYVVAVTLAPAHHAVFGWQARLPVAARLPLDVLWIAIVGVIVAGFMAPVETLGWWAGWYGDPVTPAPAGVGDTPVAAAPIARFVVYLDGISQSSSRYTADVEAFLDALAPRLPRDVRLVRGVMTYSVANQPLDDDPVLAWFWRAIDALRFANPASLIGMFVNLRNVLIVAVSADQRYGPLYNRGIAQLVYDALVTNGYRPGSGTPVTLVGYSGGGQMSAASGVFIKRAIDAPVDVISLGGVISGNARILELEHLYHFVGTKDGVERLGPIMFPSRWRIAVLSSWNRAVRLGRLTRFSLGPVGHQVPGGMMDPALRLPDGRTALEQTVQVVIDVLAGRITADDPAISKQPGNYERYAGARWNQPASYPIAARVDPERYHPLAPWMGRLMLPRREQRTPVRFVWFEVHHAPPAYAFLVGTTVKLRWCDDPVVADLVRAVTRDVHFSARADYTSRYRGIVHPVRIDHWQLVDPLESLAGAHPVDDVIVMLDDDVAVEARAETTTLRIARQPVQITGRYYGLVRFIEPAAGDRYVVAHFDRATRSFDGPRETVSVPPPVTDTGGRAPSNIAGIERSPVNAAGWYIYGSPDADGTFVVRALGPRELLAVTPRERVPAPAAFRYVHDRSWHDLVAHTGATLSVQLGSEPWTIGDVALLIHVYGGIGGARGEKAASGAFYFGHFAYGVVRIVHDPVADEARFEVVYQQVYCHNTDGLIAGRLHWSRYLGDRQFGWLGLRPTCDILVRDRSFGESYRAAGGDRSPLEALALQLDAMTARYRIGDGTGGTYPSAANNCAQDSNRALFEALRALAEDAHVAPGDETRFARLVALTRRLRRTLQPFGAPRRDWSDNTFNLGSTLEDAPLQQLHAALGSWRVILPRLAADTIVHAFTDHGADGWVLGTDQVPARPELRPIVPLAL